MTHYVRNEYSTMASLVAVNIGQLDPHYLFKLNNGLPNILHIDNNKYLYRHPIKPNSEITLDKAYLKRNWRIYVYNLCDNTYYLTKPYCHAEILY